MTKRITLTDSGDQTPNNERHATTERADIGILPATYSATELLRLLLRRRRVIATVTCVVTFLAAGLLFLIPNKYASEASLLPSGSQDKMADLKRLAGFGTMSFSDENSSELFPEILRSRTVQDSVLARRYHFSHGANQMTLRLPEYFGEDNPDKLREKLNEVTYISLDKKTGVIDMAVETEYPDLSRQVLLAYLSSLESFNLYARRSAARDNALYLGRQIDQTKVDLTASEDSLEAYQASNRNWLEGSSPDLLKTIAQLQREVEIQNKKYLYLTQQYEIAKLDAQKDVPIMRVLDQPSTPVEKSSPKRGLLLLTIALSTGLLSSFWQIAADIVRKRMTTNTGSGLQELGTELTEAFPLVTRFTRPQPKIAEREEVKV